MYSVWCRSMRFPLHDPGSKWHVEGESGEDGSEGTEVGVGKGERKIPPPPFPCNIVNEAALPNVANQTPIVLVFVLAQTRAQFTFPPSHRQPMAPSRHVEASMTFARARSVRVYAAPQESTGLRQDMCEGAIREGAMSSPR